DELPDPPGHRVRLGRLVVELGEVRCRALRALTDQPEPGPGRAAPGGLDHPVGEVDHLRRGPVVALQPERGGLREPAGEAVSAGRRRLPHELRATARWAAGEIGEALAKSSSPAGSRTDSLFVAAWTRAAGCATSRILPSSTCHGSSVTSRGQKYLS